MSKTIGQSKIYHKYWGKARKDFEHHPLYLHCLDVVAVAHEWWNNSPVIQRSFTQDTGLSERQVQAWVQFFIALHDLGKLDIRFQNKVPKIAPYNDDVKNKVPSQNYDHGENGYMWFVQESKELFQNCTSKQKRYLQDWLAHTSGHHGKISNDPQPNLLPSYLQKEAKQDQIARKAFIEDMADLFLKPQNINFENINLPEKPPVLMAGFCSVCDWLGSNTDYFKYEEPSKDMSMSTYFESKKAKAREVLKKYGLLRDIVISKGGMDQVYPHLKPRDVQTLVSQLNCEVPSLIIIEASTGSGKTETAIAIASCLLAKGLADSLTFALPTQATANAILNRLKDVSEKIFSSGPNVILAHGKSPYNTDFKALIEKSSQQIEAEGNGAGVQCHEWLSLSRRRAFLGQIAVTTIDQVLLSAITSLKHSFVRSFGIAKSVLIIDEVHAYDAYMYGLLEEVIKVQKQAGGSVILLSATLPWYQKKRLLKVWNTECSQNEEDKDKYPLIMQAVHSQDPSSENSNLKCFSLKKGNESRNVSIELWSNNDMVIDQSQLEGIAKAVKEQKAKVGVICNLVNDAQTIAEQLKALNTPVDILHSRYRYKDRMNKEESLIAKYGKDSIQDGCVLVGTQVLEQSLDIDFDWLVTFLCPVDLLFQRMGRLHRHAKQRPKGFKTPRCVVILPDRDKIDYKSHKHIYKNQRVLWRTQQLLYDIIDSTKSITFPKAYRNMIEHVYQKETWKDEPKDITEAFEKYQKECEGSLKRAKTISNANTFFSDNDEQAFMLTRDGQGSLSVIPVVEREAGQCFLDSETCLNRNQYEELVQNMIPVPVSWRSLIEAEEEQGIYYLLMQNETHREKYLSDNGRLCYSVEYGLKKLTC